MIVPSMSYEEMRKEFLHDLHIAEVKAQPTYKQLHYEMHKRHQTHATETVIWQSPLRNTWMSIYGMNGVEVDCLHICVTMDHQSLLKTLSGMAFGLSDEMYLAEFNIHFYKRYNERLRLNLPKPLLIAKHYFKNNLNHGTATRLSHTEVSEKFKIFLPVKGGVLLGYRYNDKKWVEVKTFVSDEMLKESQMEMVEYLKNYKLES